MFYEYETIKYLIFWHPPENVRVIWAEHLHGILTKTNEDAPMGWLWNLLHPIGSKKGKILKSSEKEMILYLHQMLKLAHGKSLVVPLAKMSGFSERTIRSLVSKSVCKDSSNKSLKEHNVGTISSQTFETPQHQRKRKVEQRTPLTREMGKCKQLITFATPQSINSMKSYSKKVEGFIMHPVEGSFSGDAELLEKVDPKPMVLNAYELDDENMGLKVAFSKLMVDKEVQTDKETQAKANAQKKHRRRTILKINKPKTTIKILAQSCNAKNVTTAFKSSFEVDELDKTVDRTIQRSAHKIASLIAIVCDNNPNTAARALVKVLKLETYLPVKNSFEDKYMSEAKKIVSGIKHFVADHSNLPEGGTRRMAEQNAVSAVLLAAVWDVDSSENMGRKVTRAIGVKKDTIMESIQRATEMKEKGERFKPEKRKMRKDNVQEAAYTYIQKWQHSDENTRIDTNTWKEKKSINPFTNEEQRCPRRVWSVTGAERNFKIFKDSPEYQEFQRMTIDVKGTIGLTTFEKYICPCTREPTAESCVDPLISETQHLMAAVKEGLAKLTDHEKIIIAGLLGYGDLMKALKKGRAVEMVEACCCPRKEQIEFKINDKHPVPKLLSFTCGDGTCMCCGFENRFREIFEHQIIKSSDLLLKVCIWEEAVRQGVKASGKQNTQLELTEKDMTLSTAAALFQKCLKDCLPHVIKIEWMNAVRSFDVYNVGPNNIVIMTDFAATLDLRAMETVNSSIDAHAFLDNFIVISNRRDASVQTCSRNGDEEVRVVSINDCDVLQYFGSTMSKGKKNDYVTHNACLKEIIQRYIKEFEERQHRLTFVIVWTDNCPNQYKCKENFVGILKIEEIFGVFIVHCFAVKDNFKGVWDGAGKVVKNFLWRLEQQKTRSATAFECFENTKNAEFEFDDRESWKKCEETKDPYLLQRNTFTYTRRIIGLVVDDRAQYDEYSLRFPGSIVLADRTEVPTLKHAVKDTTKQHQVAFCKRERGTDYGFLNLQQFPCRCTQCRDCLFSPENVIECPYDKITKSLRSEKTFITIKKQKEKAVNGGTNISDEGNENDRNYNIP
jgi:hypothetical protein